MHFCIFFFLSFFAEIFILSTKNEKINILCNSSQGQIGSTGYKLYFELYYTKNKCIPGYLNVFQCLIYGLLRAPHLR